MKIINHLTKTWQRGIHHFKVAAGPDEDMTAYENPTKSKEIG